MAPAGRGHLRRVRAPCVPIAQLSVALWYARGAYPTVVRGAGPHPVRYREPPSPTGRRISAMAHAKESPALRAGYFLPLGQKFSSRVMPEPVGFVDSPVVAGPPERASASWAIECVMAARGACSISGTPLLRTSTIVR